MKGGDARQAVPDSDSGAATPEMIESWIEGGLCPSGAKCLGQDVEMRGRLFVVRPVRASSHVAAGQAEATFIRPPYGGSADRRPAVRRTLRTGWRPRE